MVKLFCIRNCFCGFDTCGMHRASAYLHRLDIILLVKKTISAFSVTGSDVEWHSKYIHIKKVLKLF